jgi:hypothetical protein
LEEQLLAQSPQSPISLGLLASGFSEHLGYGPAADCSRLRSPDRAVKKLFQFLKSGNFGFIAAQRPFKNEVSP